MPTSSFPFLIGGVCDVSSEEGCVSGKGNCMEQEREEKLTKLRTLLQAMDSAVVAFSGGVDSTFLLHMAMTELGTGKVLAVTGQSPTYPAWEFEEARQLARQLGVRQLIVATEELASEEFAANPPKRCYFCKQELFSHLRRIAGEEGLKHILDGTNLDDLGDYRPGRQAAQEMGVRSPLLEAGLTKEDIRICSRARGLATWDKPACACLASRFPYGAEITREKLRQVEEGEDYLRSLGFRQFRLRHHGPVVRIEIDREQMALLLVRAEEVSRALRQQGFNYVTMDLDGYRTGSMNEMLPKEGRKS